MDAEAFDRLVKRMGGAADRRRLLAGLGAALAGLLGQPVAAKDPDKPNGKTCNKNAQCRSRNCCSAGGKNDGRCRECCNDGDCGPGRLCQHHECVPDPGTCTAGQNLCHDGTAPCDNRPGCRCVSTTSGATFCGSGSRCSTCTRDEDCTAVTGPGSVCADYTGDFCSCYETNRRVCVAPCAACTSDQQCSQHQRCCDGQCQDCCTTADCGGAETCEEGRCVCHGCRSRINNTCVAGTAWATCGANGAGCAACAQSEVCAAGRQTCVHCEANFDSPAARTWCDAVTDFAAFQCAPNCGCAALHQGSTVASGVCFGGASYCSSQEPICTFAADCVIEGLGTHCVPVGTCGQAPNCTQTVCVTQCGTGASGGNTGAGDSPPRIVVLD
jgi:hypothetical protein